MRFVVYSCITAIVLFCTVSNVSAQGEEYISVAKKFITLFEAQRYAECLESADTSLAKQLSVEALAAAHTKIRESLGSLLSQGESLFDDNGKVRLVYVECKFEKQTLDYKIIFTAEKKILGFFLVAPVPKEMYVLPSYAHLDSTVDIPITVVSDSMSMPGDLLLPKGVAHPPVVVLIHGSGPNDRDETIHSNRPFKDIAYGLAAKGIATLRFDKRTFVYKPTPLGAESITPKEEVTLDALSAIGLLRSRTDVDTSKIFLLGHSLGAMMAPLIAEEDSRLAGIIMMAVPARPFEDLLLEQMEFLLPQQLGKPKADSELTVIRSIIETIKANEYTTITTSAELLGLPPSYWTYLHHYDQVKTAQSLSLPMLLLQGGRDYQVGSIDYHIWKEALAKKDNASFEYFEDLYHLFMPGIGNFTDYQKSGNVSEKVIDTLARWIKNH